MLTKGDINWLKSEFIPEVIQEVKKEFSSKIDTMNTKLDTFIGEIKTRREEDTLHQGDHDEIQEKLGHHSRRLSTIEKRLQISTVID